MKAFLQHNHKDSDKKVLQALVPFLALKDKVLFTCKANPNSVIQANPKELARENVDYYQRRIDEKRLKSMQEYISRSILDERGQQGLATIFPTSLILAMTTDKVIEEHDGVCEIDFDSTSGSDDETNMFIVDGQHRMMAMIKLYDTLTQSSVIRTENVGYVIDYLENYKFNCTILVNYDLWEQSQVFVDVNFKQKPVNKSLYYEVFGSEYIETSNDSKRNKIYHAHTLVSRLNTNKKSPFYNRIKMLGTGAGYISQAFFVESLLLLFKPGKVWYAAYGKNLDLRSHTAELLTFFMAVKDVLAEYWPKESDTRGTLVCKTTGVGAFVRLMAYLHQALDESSAIIFDLSATNEGEKCPSYYAYIKKKLLPLRSRGREIFGDDSKFLKASGKATESHLYKTILEVIAKAERPEDNRKKEEVSFELDSICDQLQDYLWTNTQDELDALGHHYEYGSMDNVYVLRTTVMSERCCRVLLSFDSSVTIYLDKEEDSGMSYSFPTTAEFDVEKTEAGWKIDEHQKPKLEFDTSKY